MERVHPISEQQAGMKAMAFLDCYGIKVKISGFTFNDQNWNWNKVIQKYTDPAGKNYGLIEHFKEGENNDTSFVYFEYEDKSGKLCQEKFEKFLDAERAMVHLIQRRLKGED